jgi:hypothetical protein
MLQKSRLFIFGLLLILSVGWLQAAFAQDPASTPEPGSDGECPLGKGYWKNHAEAWPVDSLTLGSQSYTQDELLALLGMPVVGDASIHLAHHLITAMLNVAKESATSAEAAGAISQANATLIGYTGKLPYTVAAASPEGQLMLTLAGTLESYNTKILTPECESIDDIPVIVVEGPVEAIEGNLVTIQGYVIIFDLDDPLLLVLRIGDVLRIEGELNAEGLVVIFFVISITVYVDIDGEVYYDDGSCDNPPPPWAPAHGWRERCGGEDDDDDPDDQPGNGMGMGMGMGQ